jgi:hypothetical protein
MSLTTTIVGLYRTRTGKVGAEVKRTDFTSGKTVYSWQGAWGAGCGTKEHVLGSVKLALAERRGVETIIEFKA